MADDIWGADKEVRRIERRRASTPPKSPPPPRKDAEALNLTRPHTATTTHPEIDSDVIAATHQSDHPEIDSDVILRKQQQSAQRPRLTESASKQAPRQITPAARRADQQRRPQRDRETNPVPQPRESAKPTPPSNKNPSHSAPREFTPTEIESFMQATPEAEKIWETLSPEEQEAVWQKATSHAVANERIRAKTGPKLKELTSVSRQEQNRDIIGEVFDREIRKAIVEKKLKLINAEPNEKNFNELQARLKLIHCDRFTINDFLPAKDKFRARWQEYTENDCPTIRMGLAAKETFYIGRQPIFNGRETVQQLGYILRRMGLDINQEGEYPIGHVYEKPRQPENYRITCAPKQDSGEKGQKSREVFSWLRHSLQEVQQQTR